MTAPMSDPVIPDEAVEAAARAWYNEIDSHALDGISIGWAGADDVERRVYAEPAEIMLAAAYPHIERQVREQVASEILAERGDVDRDEPRLYERGIAYGLAAAARVARGGSDG